MRLLLARMSGHVSPEVVSLAQQGAADGTGFQHFALAAAALLALQSLLLR